MLRSELIVQIGRMEDFTTFERQPTGHEQIESPTMAFELLNTAVFGWAFKWSTAMQVATLGSAHYQQRHRVYWSPQGKAWMVRRAFDLSGRG